MMSFLGNRVYRKVSLFISAVILMTAIMPGLGLVTENSIAGPVEIQAGTRPISGTPYDDTRAYSVSAPHIIINQVYGAGKDGYVSHSFIELYNPTSITVDMGGWFVQYKSSEDGKVTEWQKLELTSSINAYSSYLIRCQGVEDDSNVQYTISSCDQEWDQSLYNKGLSVVLVASDNDIAGEVFDNSNASGGVPTIDYYVDMLSAAGNDYDEADSKKKKQKPYHYEGEFSAIQSKKKSIRRKGFKDTDNNAADTEAVDYSNENSYKDRRPRSSADGEWKCTEIKFSHLSGFYDDPFDLEMSTLADGDIYYTLDGSVPNPLSSNTFRYDGPIRIEDATNNPNVYSMRTDISLGYTRGMYAIPNYNVDKCTILRAAVFSDKAGEIEKKVVISDTYTSSYFVGMGGRDSINNLYVVSLTCEPDDMFGYENGIYVLGKQYDDNKLNSDKWQTSDGNFRKRGRESERRCNISIFDTKRNNIVSQNSGVRIHGNYTRSFAQKSLSIYAREEYDGNKRIMYDIFGTGKNPNKITLFSGGQDYIGKNRDYIVNTACMNNNNFDVLHMIPCSLFLNGEYWGMYFITDNYDDKYIEDKYGVKDDDVVIVKNNVIEEGREDDISLWKNMCSFIAYNDMSSEENYKKACELIDIDSFIHYYATEIYICNTDWVFTNIRAWRARKQKDNNYYDGRWRWMLFDMNESMREGNSPDFISYTIARDLLFRSLMCNKDFREEFARVLREIGTGKLSNSNTERIINKFREDYLDSLEESNKRYRGGNASVSEILRKLEDNKAFFQARYSAINGYMQDCLDNPSYYLRDKVTHVASVSASCVNTGTKEHWVNERTHKLFYDDKCRYEISDPEDIVIPVVSHNYIEEVIAPSRGQRGYTMHSCIVCGYSYKDNYIDYEDSIIIPKDIIPEDSSIPNNNPTNYVQEKRGDFTISYYQKIPFWGKSKVTVSNFGEIVINYNGQEYKADRIKVNKRNKSFQITGLEGSNYDIEKMVKDRTSGKNRLYFDFNPFHITDNKSVNIKKKKNGLPKTVKVIIGGVKYKLSKKEWNYDDKSKELSIFGLRVNGLLHL